MTFTTYNEISLEEVEKMRGLCEFYIKDIDHVSLKMEEISPKSKRNNEIVIIRDGRNKHNGKNTELF
jgi:hypothetical protein